MERQRGPARVGLVSPLRMEGTKGLPEEEGRECGQETMRCASSDVPHASSRSAQGRDRDRRLWLVRGNTSETGGIV